MSRLFSFSFWLQIIISTFFTMCIIYLIKNVANKVEIPVVSNIAAGV